MKTAAEHYDEAMDRADARIKKINPIPATSQGHWTEIEREECIAAIDAAVAEVRARWREWCIKFSEQPIPEALMAKAEEKPVSIRDAILLGWSSVLLALQAEVIREKRGE